MLLNRLSDNLQDAMVGRIADVNFPGLRMNGYPVRAIKLHLLRVSPDP